MKLKNNYGYSMIEIGVGLLIITVFSIFSVGIFNGCYNNYHAIQSRNIALKYAVSTMERVLQTNDLSELGFTEDMITRSSILSALDSASIDDRTEGKYAVPVDLVEDGITTEENVKVNDNYRITTKFRRIPTSSDSVAYDNTVLKVIVIVEYKIRTNDPNWRTLELESIKVTKQ